MPAPAAAAATEKVDSSRVRKRSSQAGFLGVESVEALLAALLERFARLWWLSVFGCCWHSQALLIPIGVGDVAASRR
jgi:hypothetical protein